MCLQILKCRHVWHVCMCLLQLVRIERGVCIFSSVNRIVLGHQKWEWEWERKEGGYRSRDSYMQEDLYQH